MAQFVMQYDPQKEHLWVAETDTTTKSHQIWGQELTEELWELEIGQKE
jgi:hypothetical protein